MFHDTFAVELGLAGAPIDKVSLSFATRQCQSHGALCSSTVHGHGPDAARTRRREQSVSPSRFRVTTC